MISAVDPISMNILSFLYQIILCSYYLSIKHTILVQEIRKLYNARHPETAKYLNGSLFKNILFSISIILA